MRKVKTIWMFLVLAAFCLGLATITLAEPPKNGKATWKMATAISVNPQARLTAAEDEDQEISIPDVWFGNWGENGKYQLGFYAERVNPKYQVVYGIKEQVGVEGWNYVSVTDPQDTEVVHNPENRYETSLLSHVQSVVYVPSPGEYYLEVRVYVTPEWYFLYKKVVDVPVFEVWLSEVCKGEEGQTVTLKFIAVPFFSLEFKEGEKVLIEIGDGLFFESKLMAPNEWGENYFEIVVDSEIYNSIYGFSSTTTFSIEGEEPYSHDLYYWEGGDCSGKAAPVPQVPGKG